MLNIKFEDFPKKCIKCKRSDIELIKFGYGKTRSKNFIGESFRTVHIYFPACESCAKEFRKHRRKIKKYIDLKMDGSVIIKDIEYLNEVNENRLERIHILIRGPSENELFFCPKCDSKQIIGTDFCMSCGKDLRNIKINKKV